MIVFRSLFARLFLLGLIGIPAMSHPAPRHGLTVDDVLHTVSLEHASFSPDRQLIAAVVQRPARIGEIFGRTAYEIDPSRSDVWLISRTSGVSRNLTLGQAHSAGFWCATWSPDGRRLAMLSTKPESEEPRGGSNVHLYVWDRSDNTLRRASAAAMSTQTRYGSPFHALDLRASDPHADPNPTCRKHEENAPFLWLDDHRLLAVAVQPGQVSPLLDQYGRLFAHTDETRRSIANAVNPTASRIDTLEPSSGGNQNPALDLRLIDLDTRADKKIATIQPYPFNGALAIRLSPDRDRAAILLPAGRLQTVGTESVPHNAAEWRATKKLGLFDVAPASTIRWMELPAAARLPLELFDWSPDGSKIAFRARSSKEASDTAYFVGDARSLKVRRAGTDLTSAQAYRSAESAQNGAQWAADEVLLLKGRRPGADRDDWWLARPSGGATNLTQQLSKVPSGLWRSGSGFAGLTDRGIVLFEAPRWQPRLAPSTEVTAGGRVITPQTGRTGSGWLAVQDPAGAGVTAAVRLGKAPRPVAQIDLPPGTMLDQANDSFLWYEQTKTGSTLWEIGLATGSKIQRYALNGHLANVAWGETRIVDYGSARKAAVILPPDFDPRKRYPVVTWVYPGYVVNDESDYFLDPYLPGIYNLQLYAAKGFVVLIPSMPGNDPQEQVLADSYLSAVEPAIDHLIQMGIAAPRRIAVMGHSQGGYAVYSLLTRTNRFSSAVAMSGMTDLTQFYYQFDPLARGRGPLEGDPSENASILERGSGFQFGASPAQREALYSANSPLRAVARVSTPVLIVHGDQDTRGSLTQADTFFSALKREGKQARLLRYWGESHSLAQSPANIRDIFNEVISWMSCHGSYQDRPPARQDHSRPCRRSK